MAEADKSKKEPGLPHEIRVAHLKALLNQLEDSDILVVNQVGNLSIYRDLTEIGHIDLLVNHQKISLEL